MPTIGMRIKIQNVSQSGIRRSTRKLILVEPPFPVIGDGLQYDGEPWTVISTERAEVIMLVKTKVEEKRA